MARAIREKDSTAIIVFVTTHFEFMLLTYHSLVGAIDFIDKNLNDAAFEQRLELCLKEALKHQKGKMCIRDRFMDSPSRCDNQNGRC